MHMLERFVQLLGKIWENEHMDEVFGKLAQLECDINYKVHDHQAHFQDGTSISTHCSGYFATVYFEAWKLIHTAVQPVKGN